MVSPGVMDCRTKMSVLGRWLILLFNLLVTGVQNTLLSQMTSTHELYSVSTLSPHSHPMSSLFQVYRKFPVLKYAMNLKNHLDHSIYYVFEVEGGGLCMCLIVIPDSQTTFELARIHNLELVRWLSVYRYLSLNLRTRVWSLGPNWWKEISDTHKFFSSLHTCAMACMCMCTKTCTHTHTYTSINQSISVILKMRKINLE